MESKTRKKKLFDEYVKGQAMHAQKNKRMGQMNKMNIFQFY